MYLRRRRSRGNVGVVRVRADDSKQEFSARQNAGGNGMDSGRRIFDGRLDERPRDGGDADGLE